MSSSQVSHRVQLLQSRPQGQLLIHEIYRSLQGESTFQGLPCVFVRLAVCDARCIWCDTPHAFNEGKPQTIDQVVKEVLELKDPLVEITGGEPLLQEEVHALINRLVDAGKTVLLETSGAHDISKIDRRVHIIMDLKCPDSGEEAGNRWSNLEHLKPNDQVKFVVASAGDFHWAETIIREHRLDQRFTVLLSPVFGKVKLVELAEWLLRSGLQVRMQLQMHKFIWDPNQRGV